MRLPVFAVLPLLIALGACSTKLQQLRAANPQGEDFHLALAREYLTFAEAEANQFDWWDSRYFAKKGLRALSGENVEPETLERWNIPPTDVPTLLQARDDLLALLGDYEVRDKYHRQTARVLFLFDCWLEQQEEGWQSSDVISCREEFYATLDNIYLASTPDNRANLLTERQDAEKQEKSTIVFEVTTPKIEPQFVYFDFNSIKLNAQGRKIVNNLITTLKGSESYDITLNGYADRSGKADYNLKLSKQRAQAIKTALVEGGLKEKSITIFAFGEAEEQIPTKDGTPEKGNRVVEIVIDR